MASAGGADSAPGAEAGGASGLAELAAAARAAWSPEDGGDGYALRDIFSKARGVGTGLTYDDVILLPGEWGRGSRLSLGSVALGGARREGMAPWPAFLLLWRCPSQARTGSRE